MPVPRLISKGQETPHGLNPWYTYLAARIRQDATVAPLADLIGERATGPALGESWRDLPPQPAWKPVDVSMWHG